VKEEQARTASAISHLVIAASAVFSIIMQSRAHPVFSGSLVALAFLLIGANYQRAIRSWLGARAAGLSADRQGREEHPEALRFIERFGSFVADNSTDNLRHFRAFFDNDRQFETAFGRRDYLPDHFVFFKERCISRPPRDAADFRLRIREFTKIVKCYNLDYVIYPMHVMRQTRWLDSLQGARGDVERGIDQNRERWVAFLDSYEQWVGRLQEKWQPSERCGKFEYPQRL
jgi:hypothetical protein